MPYADLSMSIGSVVLVLELGLAAGAVLLAWLALRDAGSDRRQPRERLRLELARSRLGGLLARRDIGAGEYLAAVPTAEIKRQLAKCRTCPQKRRCDQERMAAGSGRGGNRFCPNLPAIERYLRMA